MLVNGKTMTLKSIVDKVSALESEVALLTPSTIEGRVGRLSNIATRMDDTLEVVESSV